MGAASPAGGRIMTVAHVRNSVLAALALLLGTVSTSAQDAASSDIALVIETGQLLRVALDERIRVEYVGQPITGTLLDPVYAYDRVVVPAKTVVCGHVERLEQPPTRARVQAWANGQFSPNAQVVLQFDSLHLADGSEIPIQTHVTGAAERMTLQTAPTPGPDDNDDDHHGVRAQAHDAFTQARRDAEQKVREALASIKSPDKSERVKATLINHLPYHPQYLAKGTVYTAELLAPLTLGSATAVLIAPPGSKPAPASILTARLVTTLESATTPRGAPIEAVLTEPVFSADHELVLPEGSRLTGVVTLATPARRFHRRGQLRFLFQSVQAPQPDAVAQAQPDTVPLLASLYSVQVGDGTAVEVDDEGGTQARDSKTRFIAPALAVVALLGMTRTNLDAWTMTPTIRWGHSRRVRRAAGRLAASSDGDWPAPQSA
jgi:hypothetical protein